MPGAAARPVRRRRRLRQWELPCAARMTSSRGSIDEDQLEAQREEGGKQRLAGGSSRNGNGLAVPPAAAAAAQQQPVGQQQQQQQVQQPGGERSQPGEPPPGQDEGGSAVLHPLSIKQLQALTELHVEDAYACGIVGSAAELAACLGTDLRDGLCEDQVGAG